MKETQSSSASSEREETDSPAKPVSDDDLTQSGRNASFPIVGIGASAGGLEALQQLFRNLPPDTGMAFVVIQHLDPSHPSLLGNLLGSETQMPVVELAEGMRVEPNRVHVICPNADCRVQDGHFALVSRLASGNLHLPINLFFRSLAASQPGRAIGVVLSGSGSDGTEGLLAIKARGGITLIQDPKTAQFRSMPASALAAGAADFSLSPRAIAQELARLSHHAYLARAEEVAPAVTEEPPEEAASLTSVLGLVQQHAQLDFTGYKRPTLLRRVARRMALRRVATLREYVESVRSDPGEAKALAEDILIHVTSFFRDPAAFEALKTHVFPELLKHKEEGGTLRVWVPGCSTGEETYSLAICLLEYLDSQERKVAVKFFGSDVSEQAIATARAGLYAAADLAHVDPERLTRFFERADGDYRIAKRVREVCVYVKHDLTRDAPFARLDLVSCRNVLIYFDTELQSRVLPMLHYCLGTPGYLFLGHSEAPTGFQDLFVPIDKGHRIFLKTGENRRPVTRPALRQKTELALFGFPERRHPASEALRQADQYVLDRYAPAGVIVNERLEVVQFRGRTASFLEPPPGQPQTNVLRMARPGLVARLHEAIELAKTQKVAVRKQGVQLYEDHRSRLLNIEVVPLPGLVESAERHFLILFEEVGAEAVARAPARVASVPVRPDAARADQEASQMKAELATTWDYLESLVREHQSTSEELATTNEELIATNEELQSMNEELQSAQEELQSVNEELNTVNDELRQRNQELDLVASDLVNVLESVQIPILIVDGELRVRRFTPTAQLVARLIPGDLGRSIEDVKLKLKGDNLVERIRETLATLTPKEWDVQGLDDRWFRLQIRPYRAADNRLDGAVLSFIDVDTLKRALRTAESARDYAHGIVETVSTALVVLDSRLQIVSANHAFFDKFSSSLSAIEGMDFFALAAGAWEVPAVREALQQILLTGSPFRDLEIRRDFPGIGRKDLALGGRRIQWENGGSMILVAIEDISNRRQLEEERALLLASEQQARRDAERANRAKDLFLATLSHELRTPLNVILMSAQLLRRFGGLDPTIKRASSAIERAVVNQARLIDDLLDISRIVSGKLLLDLQAVKMSTVVRSALDVAQDSATAKGLTLLADIAELPGSVYGDPIRLQQVVTNLLNNAIKFTPTGGRIEIHLAPQDGRVELQITDTGIGIRPEVLPQLFSRFVQADSTMTRLQGGLGLGLAIVRHLVEVHGGEVHGESLGEGHGATFRVSLPLAAPDALPMVATTALIIHNITGVRVLVVEDDDDTREAVVAALIDMGARVRGEPSCAAGLSAVADFMPQAILCDIAMPVEDGYCFIRKLRSLNADLGGLIPAAALTALAGDDDQKQALRAGFQLHLAKPIDSARMAKAIETLAGWTKPI